MEGLQFFLDNIDLWYKSLARQTSSSRQDSFPTTLDQTRANSGPATLPGLQPVLTLSRETTRTIGDYSQKKKEDLDQDTVNYWPFSTHWSIT